MAQDEATATGGRKNPRKVLHLPIVFLGCFPRLNRWFPTLSTGKKTTLFGRNFGGAGVRRWSGHAAEGISAKTAEG